jgi:hypothetical protein
MEKTNWQLLCYCPFTKVAGFKWAKEPCQILHAVDEMWLLSKQLCHCDDTNSISVSWTLWNIGGSKYFSVRNIGKKKQKNYLCSYSETKTESLFPK